MNEGEKRRKPNKLDWIYPGVSMNTRHRGKDKSTENVLKIESVKRDLISHSALLPDNFIAPSEYYV